MPDASCTSDASNSNDDNKSMTPHNSSRTQAIAGMREYPKAPPALTKAGKFATVTKQVTAGREVSYSRYNINTRDERSRSDNRNIMDVNTNRCQNQTVGQQQ